MAVTHFQTAAPTASPNRLRVEFALFFLAAPLVMAVVLPARLMFPMLGGLTFIGLILLIATPGFRWRELTQGVGRIGWGLVAGVVLTTFALGLAVIALALDGSHGFLIERNPGLMLMIAAFYPFVSALPQEIVFRPLFFRRYAPILPGRPLIAILLNAAVFSFAHLMYWNWVVAVLTFLGGLVFAWSYRMRGNFPEAVVAHSLAGIVLFAMGLGVFFYSGNVVRPF